MFKLGLTAGPACRLCGEEKADSVRECVCGMFLKLKGLVNRKWVPVTTVWRVLRLRKEERPPIWRVAANILNKQSRRADKG